MGFTGGKSLLCLLFCSSFSRGAEGCRFIFCKYCLLISGVVITGGRGAELPSYL